MNILLVTHFFPSHGGGVEAVAGELARRLLCTGDVGIEWFASNTDPAPDWRGLSARPVRAWNGLERRFEVPLPIWMPGALPQLWRAVGASDVVHVHDAVYPGNVIACGFAIVRGKPFVVTQHVGSVPYRNPLLRGLAVTANVTVARWLLRRAARTVFISEVVQEYFARLCRWRTKPLLIPNGVDTEFFRPPTSQERNDAMGAMGRRVERPAYLYVGRFVDKKGLPLLRRLATHTPEADWYFAGWGPSDPARWGLANVHVFNHQTREGVRALLWACDLLLLPSESEGFPLVVQEAAACGVPCLVTSEIADAFPAVRDILLREPLGPGAEERWLRRLDALAPEALDVEARRTRTAFAVRYWSWSSTVSDYLQVFKQVSKR